MPAFKFCPICDNRMKEEVLETWPGGERRIYFCTRDSCKTNTTQDYGERERPTDSRLIRRRGH